MGHWEIAKEFGFDYGHRVWSQTLHCDFSIDSKCACRHLHGHRGTIMVYLRGDELKDGMVTDFKHLNWFKRFIDSVLDHKMILDISDPYTKVILGSVKLEEKFKRHEDGYWFYNGNEYMEDHMLEVFEGLVFVEFVPTSENLSKWLRDLVNKKVETLGVSCNRVQFYETPKSQSNYFSI